MPATPDIIVPLTSDPNGTAAWIWVDSVHLDRGGNTPMPGTDSLEDRWQIQLVLRASLAIGGALVLRQDGSEIAVDLPTGVAPTLRADVARLLHDANAATAAGLVRDVAVRLAAGSLVPQEIA